MDKYVELLNNKELLQINRRNIDIIYNALRYARDIGRQEVINNYINFIKSSGRMYASDRLILFIFDPLSRTEENFQLIINSIPSSNISQLNIIFEELNRFRPLSNKEREHFSVIYESLLEERLEEGLINDDYLVNKVKLECLMPQFLMCFLVELYKKNKHLYDKSIEIIKSKNLKLEITKLENIEIFESIQEQVYCYGLPLNKLKETLKILKIKFGLNSLNLENFSEIYKIYCYYLETNDPVIPIELVNKIRELIPQSLNVNLKLLPPKSKVEIGSISQEELKALIEYFNSINRTDISLLFDFKTIDMCPNLYNLLKQFNNHDNIILTIYSDRKKDGFITLANYVKAHNFYEAVVHNVKEYNFTPLEQYIYIYNLVKSFKQYRHYADNQKKDQKYFELSRNPYIIVGNSYIVCAGFVNMDSVLLNMLGIKSANLTVTLSDEIYSDNPCHSRVLTYLQDKKYGIDGIFIGDPTFDNLGVNDFGHMLMTKSEMIDIKKDGNFIAEFREKIVEMGIDYDVFLDQEKSKKLFEQKIRSNVLLEAFRNVFMKTSSSLSLEEVDKKIEQIFKESNIEGFVPMIDPNVNLSQYLSKIDNFNLSNYFVHYLNQELYVQQIGSMRGSNTSALFVLTLKSTILMPNEINELLSNNIERISSSYVSYGINESFPSGPSIILTFPHETTVGDMIAIIEELANNLNEVLSNSMGVKKFH